MAEHPRVPVERATSTYAIGAWKDLVLWVVDGQTPVDELERLRARVTEWNRQRGATKNVALTVLHAARSTMTADERRSVARMIEETKHTRLASATVVLADGVIGALHRSILTGFSIVVPPPHPTKICADVESAIAFLHPFVESACGPIPRAHIAAMVADLHEEVRARQRIAHSITR